MKIRSVVGGLSVAGLLVAAPAFAAIGAQDVSRKLDLDEQQTTVGLDVRVGLGALQGDIGRETGTGPLFGISAGAQLWPALGIELGYEGQRLPINESLVGSGEALYRHNVGLMAKAGPLVQRHWRPFVATGLGVTYFNPSNGAEGLFSNDIAQEVPLAAGVDYNMGSIFAGARATYRLMFNEGFADEAFPNANGGNLLNASLTLGGRF